MVRLCYSFGKEKSIKEIDETYTAQQDEMLYSLDNYLYDKVKNIKKLQAKGFDNILIIDGARRAGKSILGITIGLTLDPTFDIKNMARDRADTIAKIESLRDESVLFVDESSTVMNSKESMKSEQVHLSKVVDVCGQKRLTLILILPSFFELPKQIACTHSRFLIHVYTDPQMNRGFYAYFGQKKKRILYELGKKNFNSYSKPRSDFIGRFTNIEPPFLKEYLEFKRKTLIATLRGDKVDMNSKQYKKVVKKLLDLQFKVYQIPSKFNIKQTDLAFHIGIAARNLRKWKNPAIDDYSLNENGDSKAKDSRSDVYYNFDKQNDCNTKPEGNTEQPEEDSSII